MKAEWWSQRVAPDGSVASEGIRRQLGTPRLDPLAVLVREAAQNSWDARLPGQQMRFQISLNNLNAPKCTTWRNRLLPEPAGPAALGLAACLSSPDVVLLTISDRNTSGLGGPIRSDKATKADADFVNLVRNVGGPRDKEFGGGTYGFGKGILFTISEVGTILIHSRTMWDGRPQTRLMGAALGPSYRCDGDNFTGRHWWGVVPPDCIVDPILDRDAEILANELGLPTFEGTENGTDIVVVGAFLGGIEESEETDPTPRSLNVAGEFLVATMLWNLWPLLLPDGDGRPPLVASVVVNGRLIPVPEPSAVDRLRPFVKAFQDFGKSPTTIRRRTPTSTEIGHFSSAKAPISFRPHWTDVAAPFMGPAHHCALMRQPGLIVKYVEGPASADDGIQYGSVFRSTPNVDEHFAAAEPPTHDDWIPHTLPHEQRATVDSALRQIQRRMSDLASAKQDETGLARRQPPLGQLSQMLADLLPGAPGEGGGRPIGGSGRSGSSGSNRSPAARIVAGPRLVLAAGVALIIADVLLDDYPAELYLCAVADVAIDTGREVEPPAGAGVPRVLGFEDPDGRRHDGDRLLVMRDSPRRWRVVVQPTRDTVVRLKVYTEIA